MASVTLPELRSRVRERRELPAPALRRELRRSAGASLADVAAYCGVSRQAVGSWESGTKTPAAENLRRYLEVLRLFRDEAAA